MKADKNTLLLATAALCWALPQAAGAARHELSQTQYPVDTVFIYSTGQVEKLLEKGSSWYVIEDMRKRRYKRDLNFTIPPLEYSSLTSSYRQFISDGDPDSLLQPDQTKYSSFTVTRNKSDGKTLKRSWSCSPLEDGKVRVMGKKTKVITTTCSRYLWTKLKERMEYQFDQKTGWLVKSVNHYNGKRRVKRLVAVLPPEKATPVNIMRIVRKLRGKR
ncbi:MAG: hypothetical protein ABW168_02400 [Sedimenticola sp.]